jgi:3-oxoacyl-[acyl-carrier protein] reductase
MADRYQRFASSRPGQVLTRRLGLPAPPELRRHRPGEPLLDGPALLGAAARGRLAGAIADVLSATGAPTFVPPDQHLRELATRAGARTWAYSPDEDGDRRFAGILYDASGIDESGALKAIYSFLHPVIRRIDRSGRLLVVATPPELSETRSQAVAQRALEGFVRSAAKEIGRHGATANLIYVAPDAEAAVESTLRFFLSARSAYVDGQVVRVGAGEAPAPDDWECPLAGRVAVVTGASRGIGEAIAETLARDGAHVVCLDVPAQGDALAEVANRIEGEALQLDIASESAPRTLADHLRGRHGGVDVVVHNAGVTRDRTLGRMAEDQWEMVLAVNLTSQERITEALLDEDVLRPGGRIVSVSSVSGIAGNRGQVNYATSKAGVIGLVGSLAPVLAQRQATINAVAPGFVETRMTAAMPVTTREAGRRMNSLSQGGLPVDVAETVAWLASPASGAVNGNIVRVCGQSLLGA